MIHGLFFFNFVVLKIKKVSIMDINIEKIGKAVKNIYREIEDNLSLLNEMDNESIIQNRHYLKSLKLSVIQIAESMAIILQHLLARLFKESVEGYQTLMKLSQEKGIISDSLYLRLKSFIGFRNMLIHGYWRVDDEEFLNNMRSGISDFEKFIKEIRRFLRERGVFLKEE